MNEIEARPSYRITVWAVRVGVIAILVGMLAGDAIIFHHMFWRYDIAPWLPPYVVSLAFQGLGVGFGLTILLSARAYFRRCICKKED